MVMTVVVMITMMMAMVMETKVVVVMHGCSGGSRSGCYANCKNEGGKKRLQHEDSPYVSCICEPRAQGLPSAT